MKNKIYLPIIICIVSEICALGIFIPWFKIMKMSIFIEVGMGILCMIIIGYLILFLAPIVFAISQIISIISYLYIILKYRTNRIDRKWLIISTVLLLPNMLFFNDVYLMYHAIFTFDWWGNAKYFRFPM